MVALFIFKTTSIFKNIETYEQAGEGDGLTYGNLTFQDLVNKDTDGDQILDWQENLYGLDPTKKETTAGTPDDVAIEKIRGQQDNEIKTETGDYISQDTEKLTETEKFSRELFATIATTSQNREIDQATIEQLSNSLAEKIENSAPRKIYAISDIKIIDSETKQAIQKYSDALDNIFKESPLKKGTIEILEEFITGGENITVLSELDPIINKANKIINELIKTQVPRSLMLLHLDLINNSEKLLENTSDMKLIDSDPIVAISAIIQYEKNTEDFTSDTSKLLESIRQKLNN